MALGYVFNLLQSDPRAMLTALRQKAGDLTISPEAIERLIAERALARKNKDWTRADEIRKELSEMGISLEDTPQGTTWRVKS